MGAGEVVRFTCLEIKRRGGRVVRTPSMCGYGRQIANDPMRGCRFASNWEVVLEEILRTIPSLLRVVDIYMYM